MLDDRMRAKLSDFGLSKLRIETTTTATQAGAFAGAGTLHWMAPELFKRKGRDTKASYTYQSTPAYQQSSINLTEENKSMPDYQFDTLNIRP